MNKNIAIVITAVILLGMGLITYNEYTAPVAPPFTAKSAAEENTMPETQNEASLSSPLAPKQSIAEEKKASPSAPLIAPAAPTLKPAPAISPAPVDKPAPVAQAPKIAPTPPASVQEAQKKAQALAAEKKAEAEAAAKAAQEKADAAAKAAQEKAKAAAKQAQETAAKAVKPVEDPIQKALEASRKESTLPSSLTAPAKPVVQKAPVKPAKTIKKITVMRVADGTTVRLDSSEIPQYKTMRLTSPERLVLDLDGAWKLRAPGVPPNNFVSNVRIGDHKEGTRIVIDLKKVPSDIRYHKYGESGLDVKFR